MRVHSESTDHRLGVPDVFVAEPAPSWAGTRVGDWLAFLIAATIWIKIRVVGELLCADLITLAAVPFVLSTRLRRLNSPFAKRFCVLSSIGLISLAASDFWRETVLIDLLRGWSRNGLVLITFCVLFALLRGRPIRVMYFAIGLVVQGYLAYFVTPSEFAISAPWKFGLGGPTSVLMLLIGIYLDRHHVPRWSMLACLLAGAINVLMNFRSLGGILLIAALLLWVANGVGFASLKLPKPILILITMIGIFGLTQLYSNMASRGVLGEAAEKKNEIQQGGRYGLIGGGRSEFFGSFLAIADSPILGHGSWAKDPKYQGAARQLRAAAGYKDQGVSAAGPDMDLIPMHSHLFGAWVEGGFAATLLWFWIFYRAARSLFLVAASSQLAALRTFACLSLMWDILFSPPGGGSRYTTIFFLVIVCAPEVFTALSWNRGNAVSVRLQWPQASG